MTPLSASDSTREMQIKMPFCMFTTPTSPHVTEQHSVSPLRWEEWHAAQTSPRKYAGLSLHLRPRRALNVCAPDPAKLPSPLETRGAVGVIKRGLCVSTTPTARTISLPSRQPETVPGRGDEPCLLFHPQLKESQPKNLVVEKLKCLSVKIINRAMTSWSGQHVTDLLNKGFQTCLNLKTSAIPFVSET